MPGFPVFLSFCLAAEELSWLSFFFGDIVSKIQLGKTRERRIGLEKECEPRVILKFVFFMDNRLWPR
jgi:hypothetical protein